MKIQVVNRSHHPLPQYATAQSAGMDLRAWLQEPVILQPQNGDTIVSTDVGDVCWVTGGVEGTYVAPCGDTKEISQCLGKALNYGKRTRGRERIMAYGLTTIDIAKKIESIYDSLQPS